MSESPPVVDEPLFFIDYDGTLAPIVVDPAAAYPHPEAERVLVALARRHPLWIVTGRYLRDLSGFFTHPFPAVGLHGFEEGVVGGPTRLHVGLEAEAALARMRATVPSFDGMRVEEKGPMFTVHYRQAADEATAKARLEAWLQDVPDMLAPIWGKKVVEVRPRGMDKGVAVCRLAAAHPSRTPLYLGDDVTDEDAFRALGPRAVTVKVGPGETDARYRLPGVDAAVAYLARYV